MGIDITTMVFTILTFLATVVVGGAAWRLAYLAGLTDRKRRRVEFVDVLEKWAVAREDVLTGDLPAGAAEELGRSVGVRAAELGKERPQYLTELVDEDCVQIEAIPPEHRRGFVGSVRAMRALNESEWVADSKAKNPHRARWATGTSGVHVALSGEATLGSGAPVAPRASEQK